MAIEVEARVRAGAVAAPDLVAARRAAATLDRLGMLSSGVDAHLGGGGVPRWRSAGAMPPPAAYGGRATCRVVRRCSCASRGTSRPRWMRGSRVATPASSSTAAPA